MDRLLAGTLLPSAPLPDLLAGMGTIAALFAASLALAAFLGAALFAPGRKEPRPWLLLAPLLAVLLLGAAFYFPYTNDDALIGFRYAQNLAGGHGIAFNPGEPVEGMTSLAWLFLLAPFALFGSLFAAAKLGGVALAALATWLFFVACRRASGSAAAAWFAALLFAADQNMLSWAGSGMDTALFVCWEAAFFAAVLHEEKGLWPAALLGAAGLWVRPEAFLFVPVAGGWLLWRAFAAGAPRRTLARALAPAALVAASAAALLAFRLAYFGLPLPNTFYAKAQALPGMGWEWLAGAAGFLTWPLVALSLAGLALLARRAPWAPLLTILYSAWLVKAGGDVLALRFAAFLLPLLLLGVAAALPRLAALLPGPAPRNLALAGVLLCLGIGGWGAVQMVGGVTETPSNRGNLYVMNNSIGTFAVDYPAALFLRQQAAPGDRLATDNIGATGLYSGLKIIDVAGLVDLRVAEMRFAGRAGELGRYLEELGPEWILAYPRDEPDGTVSALLPGVGKIAGSFAARYELAGYWESPTTYAKVLLRRKD